LKQPNPLAAALSQSDAEAGNVVIEKNLVALAFGQGERSNLMRCELHFEAYLAWPYLALA
jgi:hypothetical protein